MLSKLSYWIQRHSWLVIFLSLSLAFLLLNIIAYKQTHAMLNFIGQGERTKQPEYLSFLQKIKILFTGVSIPKPLNNLMPSHWNLPFQPHYFNVNDEVKLEAWYIPCSQSKGTVLIFHGYASAKSNLLPEAHAFNEMGYATFLVDFRGSGGSNRSETSIGFYEADDITKAVEYIRTISTPPPIILYGQSMGSAAILRAIYTRNIQPDAIIIEAVFDKLLSTVQNRFSAMGLPSFPAAHLLIFWGSIQKGYLGFRHNPLEYAARVQCPVLMLHGSEDLKATLNQAETVFQNLSGKKQFEHFTGVGHESYLMANPDQWKRSVSQFLAHYSE